MNEEIINDVSLKKPNEFPVMLNDMNDASYYMMPKKPRPAAVYTHADRWYAISALILGFITVKTYIESTSDSGSGFGLMASISALALTVFNFIYCRALNMKGNRTTTAIFIVNLILSQSFLICSNSAVTLLCIVMIFFGNTYFSYASYHEGRRSVINNVFRATIISPFYNYSSVFEAIFTKREKNSDKKRDYKKGLLVIIGLLSSLPLCIVVVFLLGAADKEFGKIFSVSFENLYEIIADLFGNFFLFLLSLPLGMYVFAAAYSRSYKMNHENEFEKLPQKTSPTVSNAMCAAFLTPLMLIYVVFTVLQAVHLFSASVLSAPDFSYSEYAREGFFQLCIVALINLVVIAAIMILSGAGRGSMKRILRVFTVVFCVLTHFLIVTALAKMLLYISIYGMTPKRVSTSVFMMYLFVMFAVLIIKQYKRKISFTKIGYCLAAAVLAAMVFTPVDALIAEYNITHYERGDISWMGISAMKELDASAIPVLAKVRPDDANGVYSDVQSYFASMEMIADEYVNISLWNFNVQRYLAGEVIHSTR